MQLSEFSEHLNQSDTVQFFLPSGHAIAPHFHITEIGLNYKAFIDCGGTQRTNAYVSFQLWIADDVDHRLTPDKLQSIINSGYTSLPISEDLEVLIEYQGTETIELYGCDAHEKGFILTPLQTDCLAKDTCLPKSSDGCCGGGCCC